MGENFTGWARLRVRGPRGTKVRLRYGTRIHEDHTLDARSNLHPRHVARQTDTYILKGEGMELWEPRFTLHGFRYVELTGFPGVPQLENLEGRFVRSAVETNGTFVSSNPLINRIHENVCRTFESSFQSMPQDAADRSERVAWLGDPGMVAEDIIYNYDTARFWTKWLDDIRDSQKPNGEVPYISPIHWRGSHDPYRLMPVWASTYPLSVWYLHWHYGDQRVLVDHYEGIKKLVGYFGLQASGHIIREGLGDHMEPQPDGTSSHLPKHTPPALTSTAYYYYDTWILSRVAASLGKNDDAKRYSALAEKIKDAFNRKFLNSETNQYGTGSQTTAPLSRNGSRRAEEGCGREPG
ncbi:family 78 glycoside hydrolase catalytic domain [Acidobacteria bacterium AH-259-O06]|nr:family 78 glycoside hydrolase catalytic domain [Acidobacteria bacterium AH-259-O06]